jgi:hypothetical protein
VTVSGCWHVLQGDGTVVFVRQVDKIEGARDSVRPMDVVIEVNGKSVRGLRLSQVLKVGMGTCVCVQALLQNVYVCMGVWEYVSRCAGV